MGGSVQGNLRKLVYTFFGRLALCLSRNETRTRRLPPSSMAVSSGKWRFFGRIRRPGGSAREAAPPSTHNRFLSSRLNPVHLEHRACACTRARSTSVRPSSISSAPLLVTSRHVVCRVVAKATVEVGLVIALLITNVTAARRRASRRADCGASVGVVIITSVAARCVSFVVRLI